MPETTKAARPARIYRKYGALALAVFAAFLMWLILFSGDGAGLSNNGDYRRVMKTNSMEYAESSGSFFYEDRFRMVFEGESSGEKLWNLLFSLEKTEEYPSIHLAFVRASLAGNLALNALTGQSLEVYRVQVLGAIYLVCYAALLYLLFRSFCLSRLGVDLLVKLGMLFVLCDEGYITYFNSLYSEPVQMLGLLAMAVFALRCLMGRGRMLVNGPLFFLSCVVYGWSKFINIPAAALCIAALGAVLVLRAERPRRKWLIGSGLVCIVILGSVYLSLPGWMDYETNYNSVFYGILKDTTPERQLEYLSDLGLPEEMAEFAGSNYYMDRAAPARGSEEFRAAFERVSKLDLLFFYLRHPGYFLEKLDVAMGHSGFIRPYYLSNLNETHPRLTFAHRFDGWSALRGRLPCNTWLFSGLTAAAACVVIWLLLGRGKGRKGKIQAALVLAALLGSMAYQFLMPIVTNGEGDLAKHMFAFAQFIDLLLLFLLACCGAALCLVKRLKYPAPVLAGGLAAVLCLCLLVPAGVRAVRANASHSGLEAGGYVQLGSYGGSPLVWQIARDLEDGSHLLLAVSPVEELPFDREGEFGRNLWSASDLREWLNTEFLERAFTDLERTCLEADGHRVLLSGENRELAKSGYNDFFATHVPAYSDRGLEDSLAQTVSDTVRLPDIGLLAELARSGRLDGAPCWMETPYFNNGSMVRTVGRDGYFYLRDAADSYGVRPVIRIPGDAAVSGGTGSAGNPFVLAEAD